jgi:hypothetical protein
VAPRTPRRGFILRANKLSTAAFEILYKDNARNMLYIEIAALRTCSGPLAVLNLEKTSARRSRALLFKAPLAAVFSLVTSDSNSAWSRLLHRGGVMKKHYSAVFYAQGYSSASSVLPAPDSDAHTMLIYYSLLRGMRRCGSVRVPARRQRLAHVGLCFHASSVPDRSLPSHH